MNFIKNQK